MKSKFLILIFLFSLKSLFAQEFAVINDNDGYTNVRSENSITSKILDKLNKGHLICVMNTEGNWWNIDYATNKNEIKVGYVYKDRIKLISEFNKIPILEEKEKQITFSDKAIEVKVVQDKFDKIKHSFNYVKKYPNQILKIDGKDYWGTDGEMPKTEYKSITIKFNNSTLQLPEEALENLYEPNLSSTKVNFDKSNNTIYISAMNSDGAGGYLVIWKIEKGKYMERFVAYGF
ncbi:hypothetical protein SAMN05421738_1141 [Algoriella xinjiangensis]|uniref:SH3 domain-containing protein n=1 Tax=Algoriella xinjiangensis TaxID=684065 RepID=A0A1I4ZN75_9FLAO|nr:hypothetical protein [Algoriella xinjiangensis]SFN51672.1 hypothetical protein SAMN05421738_1141 [Algoriella xinjiangensis]